MSSAPCLGLAASHAAASASARRDLPLFWPPRISSLRAMDSIMPRPQASTPPPAVSG